MFVVLCKVVFVGVHFLVPKKCFFFFFKIHIGSSMNGERFFFFSLALSKLSQPVALSHGDDHRWGNYPTFRRRRKKQVMKNRNTSHFHTHTALRTTPPSPPFFFRYTVTRGLLYFKSHFFFFVSNLFAHFAASGDPLGFPFFFFHRRRAFAPGRKIFFFVKKIFS